MPEGDLHFQLRALLYQLLQRHLHSEVTVGSDQFLYYDAGDPSRCIAPDVYVRLSRKTDLPRSWKVWERGAPEIAVEIISESDAGAAAWLSKLSHYQHVGVKELLRFDPEAPAEQLRIWDRVNETLLERELGAGYVRSSVLDLHWAVAPAEPLPLALRIAAGPSPDTLIPTAEERIAELETQLVRREA